MKILVIGGNRFFGKKLVGLLLARGDEVTVLNRGSHEDGFGAQVKRLKCDRRDPSALRTAIGEQKWDVIYDQVCYDASEAEAACEIFSGRVKHYIFTSTKSVYDYGEDFRESAFDPSTYVTSKRETLSSDYGEAKRQAEAAFFQSRAFPVVAVRFPIVLGEGDYTQRLTFHIEHVLQHRPIYFPKLEARTDFIHADEAAQVLLSLSSVGSSVVGPLNATSPDSISFQELVEMLETTLEVKAHLATRPQDGDASPFAGEQTCTLNTERLQSLGIKLAPLKLWLPKLIRENAGE